MTRPVCQEVSAKANCSTSSSLCSSGRWEFVTNFTDGVNGTGVDRVYINQGDGTLSTSSVASDGQNVTVVTYSASCCSPTVQLVAVDRVGNTATCTGRVLPTLGSTEAPSKVSTEATATSAAHSWGIMDGLWISAVLSLLGQ